MAEDMKKLLAPPDINRTRRFQKSSHFGNLSKIHWFREQKSRDTLTHILGRSGR